MTGRHLSSDTGTFTGARTLPQSISGSVLSGRRRFDAYPWRQRARADILEISISRIVE